MAVLSRKRGFEGLKKVKEALELVMKFCGSKSLGSEAILSKEAHGRVLEYDVISKIDVPPYDRSAVDGFAVRAHETFSASPSNPAFFRLKGTIEAGSSAGEISEGECYEVFTGAPMPKGADAVVMLEDCEIEGEYVKVKRAVPKFANVSIRGEDIKAGEVVIRRGELLRPWHIGVLASIGEERVVVRRRPKVAIFSTGEELIDFENAKNISNKILDSTRPMIAGALKEIGCEVVDRGIVPDDFDRISDELIDLSKIADMIITIGGTSMGGKDLVPEVISTKFFVVFHGLAVKPGKPTGFGIVNDVPVVMLPGYPVSAYIGFENIVMPVLYTWTGKAPPKREKVRAIMARRVASTPGIRHFLRVMLVKREEKLFAEPIAITGSGLLSSITKADGLVIITEDLEGLEEGSEVEVELLREGFSR
ncbi:MAG: molybdopterin molybdotransferase MoeA [Candidatus Methanomethyliaceae archaeon]|nr:molybdopterin molybdotransferase MoeA [Candidatus Methanomethyliaceae archaeon]